MSLSSLTNRGRTTKRPGEVPTHLIALSVRSSRGRINNVDEEELILGQIDYYRQRAPEYDETSSPPGNPLAPHGQRIEDALHAFAPAGKVLEIASGTGTWTRHCSSTLLSSLPWIPHLRCMSNHARRSETNGFATSKEMSSRGTG